MAEDKQTSSVGFAGAAIVLIAVSALVLIAFKAMDKYPEPKDVTTVLTSVLGPLGGIAAAAFGIKQGADAKAETTRVKKEATVIANKAARKRAGTGPGARAVRGETPDDDAMAEIEADLRRLVE